MLLRFLRTEKNTGTRFTDACVGSALFFCGNRDLGVDRQLGNTAAVFFQWIGIGNTDVEITRCSVMLVWENGEHGAVLHISHIDIADLSVIIHRGVGLIVGRHLNQIVSEYIEIKEGISQRIHVELINDFGIVFALAIRSNGFTSAAEQVIFVAVLDPVAYEAACQR